MNVADLQLTTIENDFTSIQKTEAEFIYNFLSEKKIKNTIEIGFAYGYSAAHIIAATQSVHYAIDPFQESEYSNKGLRNIESLGFKDLLNFEADYSHFALPKLIKQGLKVDFAFIDGGHRFDEIFCDVYFIDLMLNPNGYILLHDAWMRSTQYVASWIKTNKKNYKIVKIEQSNLILFQRTSDDTRPWYHFNGFFTFKSLYRHYSVLKMLAKHHSEFLKPDTAKNDV